ncbi:MAG: sulfite exporter TauE/SafE family protein [Candidatus Omnitrophota bacterium]|jgi:hypothetical protein
MSMTYLSYIFIGLLAGAFSGFFGIGGATILIPIFVLMFGMSQHQAQGTTLAVLLPPVFIFAVMKYYQHGHIQVKMALIIALAFSVGAYAGAHLVQGVGDVALRRAFGILLMIMGLRMLLVK